MTVDATLSTGLGNPWILRKAGCAESWALLEPVRNLSGTRPEPRLEPRLEPVWNLSGTRLEPVWNPSGTCLEPVWNLSGTCLHAPPVCMRAWNLSGNLGRWRVCGGTGASQQPGKCGRVVRQPGIPKTYK